MLLQVKKKKEGKSETVRRMRKYEKTRNGQRYKAREENLICGAGSVNFLRMMKKRKETQPLSPVNCFNDLHETIYHILDRMNHDNLDSAREFFMV